jgi:alpha-glucosidase
MTTTPWWKTGIVYQIYPRSFMDSSGDGVGDLRGIGERLDYLAWLGIDAIWLSPIFLSPMADFGYDVSNYTDVDPLFGSLSDFDNLVVEAHRRNIRVILDLVPNHTSDQHPWFLESRSSRDNPKRDWYIWRDAKPDAASPEGRRPPTNWLAYFGGPTWTWDEPTEQYYLHNFLPEQPDLNWHSADMRQAMFDIIRFWLNRGVDGFRIDTIDRMIKDAEFRDNPPNPDWLPDGNPVLQYLRLYSENRSGIHELIGEFRTVFDEYKERVSIGEIAYSTNPRDIVGFYGTEERPELDLPFNFALVLMVWDALTVRRFVDTYEAMLPPNGWPNYVLGNHDQIRLFSRLGDAQGRVAAMLLLTLRGTPFIYQGEELGMQDGSVPPEQYQDPQGINIGISRDLCRTPFHWTPDRYAGFSATKPWLPIAAEYRTHNVETEMFDPSSTLNFYRRLIQLRRRHAALTLGSYRALDTVEGCFAYLREYEQERFLIVLNFTDEAKEVSLTETEGAPTGMSRCSTHMDEERTDQVIVLNPSLHLRPNEGVLIEL